MDAGKTLEGEEKFLSRVVEATIRVGLIAAIVAWCFSIVRPFVLPVAWAAILAVAVHPAYRRLRRALGDRPRAAAAAIAVLGLAILTAPTALMGETVVEGTQMLSSAFREGRLAIPAPPDSIRDWPLVGEALYAQWARTSQDLTSVLRALQPQLMAFGKWTLSAAAGVGFAFLMSIVSVVIAGVILANDAAANRSARAIVRRVAGERGDELADLAGATVQSVAQGILGVAVFQSFLAGAGLLALGIPGAGLWALIGLLFCVVQIGLLPVTLPAVIYAFSTSETPAAIAFTVWMVAVSLLDNILKPLILGRGVRVPTAVIFLGSIGGFLSAGIIGLFVGAVVLVLGYTMLQAWLEPEAPEPAASE